MTLLLLLLASLSGIVGAEDSPVSAPSAEVLELTEPFKPFLSSDDPSLPLLPDETAAHIGETRQVCGNVGGVMWAKKSKGKPTFVNLGRPFPDAPFTIIIWENVRARFEQPPELLYTGGRLCVQGLIGEHRGMPQIVLQDPAQITRVER